MGDIEENGQTAPKSRVLEIYKLTFDKTVTAFDPSPSYKSIRSDIHLSISSPQPRKSSVWPFFTAVRSFFNEVETP